MSHHLCRFRALLSISVCVSLSSSLLFCPLILSLPRAPVSCSLYLETERLRWREFSLFFVMQRKREMDWGGNKKQELLPSVSPTKSGYWNTERYWRERDAMGNCVGARWKKQKRLTSEAIAGKGVLFCCPCFCLSNWSVAMKWTIDLFSTLKFLHHHHHPRPPPPPPPPPPPKRNIYIYIFFFAFLPWYFFSSLVIVLFACFGLKNQGLLLCSAGENCLLVEAGCLDLYCCCSCFDFVVFEIRWPYGSVLSQVHDSPGIKKCRLLVYMP